ncbi:MAG: DUF547 domain-containing protein [Myxococcales bacterium]|nr:DUF547 domain-containing protein [Myxococcales bacterium]MCB9547820.1 DUF547 domain-containing protein [Myxococcales bacterium]
MRIAPLVVLALALGCGEYVAYDGDGAGVAVRAPGAGDLDDATRARYAALTRLDHLGLEALLGRFVQQTPGQTRVDYAALAGQDEALLLLDQYLAQLDAVDPMGLESDAERVAYWFNAYNAAVVRGVLTFWEGDPGWSVSEEAFLFFDQPIWSFGGVVLSLNQVEHGVIRGDASHASVRSLDADGQATIARLHAGLWGGGEPDPRLHVALNCASLSCPDLAGTTPRAFRADTLEAQLSTLTAAFLANPTKGAGPAGVSSLFLWYRADFSRGGYTGVQDFIARGRADGLDGVATDRTLPYDWTLNNATGP